MEFGLTFVWGDRTLFTIGRRKKVSLRKRKAPPTGSLVALLWMFTAVMAVVAGQIPVGLMAFTIACASFVVLNR